MPKRSENGSCTATRLELQVSQDVEASFFIKKKFHVHRPLKKPFKISTNSKGYVSFFLFSWGSRRDTQADVVHFDIAAYVNFILLSLKFWLSFVGYHLNEKSGIYTIPCLKTALWPIRKCLGCVRVISAK